MRSTVRAALLLTMVSLVAVAAIYVTSSRGSQEKILAVTCSDGNDCASTESQIVVHKLVVHLKGNQFDVRCEESGKSMPYVWVKPGDLVAWRVENGEHGKVKKLKFTTPLEVFGLDDKTIRLHGAAWTWMRVQTYADTCKTDSSSGIHFYQVEGYDPTQPPPGIIVCPPTGQCG